MPQASLATYVWYTGSYWAGSYIRCSEQKPWWRGRKFYRI